MSPTRRTIVAIDGPAGSGKSTVAKILSEKLDYEYIDTGAMYRALTWKANDLDIKPDNEESLSDLAMSISIIQVKAIGKSAKRHILVDGIDVTEAIRTQPVSANVSEVSSHNRVRQIMVDMQRQLVLKDETGVVVEGRDIGTVVFPDATAKIYLTATPEERMERRKKDFGQVGVNMNKEELKEEILGRDDLDSSRKSSPLAKASDAYEIDTSNKDVDEVVDEIMRLVKKKERN